MTVRSSSARLNSTEVICCSTRARKMLTSPALLSSSSSSSASTRASSWRSAATTGSRPGSAGAVAAADSSPAASSSSVARCTRPAPRGAAGGVGTGAAPRRAQARPGTPAAAAGGGTTSRRAAVWRGRRGAPREAQSAAEATLRARRSPGCARSSSAAGGIGWPPLAASRICAVHRARPAARRLPARRRHAARLERLEAGLHLVAQVAHRAQAGHAGTALERVEQALQLADRDVIGTIRAPAAEHGVRLLEQLVAPPR